MQLFSQINRLLPCTSGILLFMLSLNKNHLGWFPEGELRLGEGGEPPRGRGDWTPASMFYLRRSSLGLRERLSLGLRWSWGQQGGALPHSPAGNVSNRSPAFPRWPKMKTNLKGKRERKQSHLKATRQWHGNAACVWTPNCVWAVYEFLHVCVSV